MAEGFLTIFLSLSVDFFLSAIPLQLQGLHRAKEREREREREREKSHHFRMLLIQISNRVCGFLPTGNKKYLSSIIYTHTGSCVVFLPGFIVSQLEQLDGISSYVYLLAVVVFSCQF